MIDGHIASTITGAGVLLAVAVGVIVTRGPELQRLLGIALDKYGTASTHWDKLIPKVTSVMAANAPTAGRDRTRPVSKALSARTGGWTTLLATAAFKRSGARSIRLDH